MKVPFNYITASSTGGSISETGYIVHFSVRRIYGTFRWPETTMNNNELLPHVYFSSIPLNQITDIKVRGKVYLSYPKEFKLFYKSFQRVLSVQDREKIEKELTEQLYNKLTKEYFYCFC